MQSPFHAMLKARFLDYDVAQLNNFVGVFSVSNIKIYPYQIAAATFAINNESIGGAVLCDESGMGKTHETMLVVAQKYLQGKKRVFIATPKPDLIKQWAETIENYYSIPYTIISSIEEFKKIQAERSSQRTKMEEINTYAAYIKECGKFLDKKPTTSTNTNPFDYDGIVLTTYDVICEFEKEIKEISWDICAFDEANALINVYQENSNKAKILKRISDNSFKLLLTGTPIEKNIMDLYGLIYFINPKELPTEQDFLHKYLRKPQNYGELSAIVSKYCFRTLRSQAKQYAKIPKRINISIEFEYPEKEQELYTMLYDYIQKPNKIAFPEMDIYDLSLKLLGTLSSSTKAIAKTLENIIARIRKLENSESEVLQLEKMLKIAQSIEVDCKTKLLLKHLPILFKKSRSLGANKKAIIFTESNETQEYLYNILKDKYKVCEYNSNTDYSNITDFKQNGEILIMNDSGAKGFNLVESAIVINYDMLFNSLKMEQRINRSQRVNQDNDVFAINYINKTNLADVRKLELMSKRHLVTNGVVGLTDFVAGGFTDNLENYLESISSTLKTKEQIQADFKNTLKEKRYENMLETNQAEELLFSTFTKEVADKINIEPKYIEEEILKLKDRFWNLVKHFFESTEEYLIDDIKKTITLKDNIAAPVLGYYFAYGRYNRMFGKKHYYLNNSDKKGEKLSLISKTGRLILDEIKCADSGDLQIEGIESCKIALYGLETNLFNVHIPTLIGIDHNKELLSQSKCLEILEKNVIKIQEEYSEYFKDIHRTAHQYKRLSINQSNQLDTLVNTKELILETLAKTKNKPTDNQDAIKNEFAIKKNLLNAEIEEKQLEVLKIKEQLETSMDRLTRMQTTRKLMLLENEIAKKEEDIFFKVAKLDIECEQKLNEQHLKDLSQTTLYRDFVIKIN